MKKIAWASFGKTPTALVLGFVPQGCFAAAPVYFDLGILQLWIWAHLIIPFIAFRADGWSNKLGRFIGLAIASAFSIAVGITVGVTLLSSLGLLAIGVAWIFPVGLAFLAWNWTGQRSGENQDRAMSAEEKQLWRDAKTFKALGFSLNEIENNLVVRGASAQLAKEIAGKLEIN